MTHGSGGAIERKKERGEKEKKGRYALSPK
jgi:hypothetical protein